MAEEVIEGEGFIVKDKRAFDTEGKVRGESKEAKKEEVQEEEKKVVHATMDIK